MKRTLRAVYRLVAYAWAAPNTLLGLLGGAVMLLLGGQMRFVSGAAEFGGGLLGRWVARLPPPCRIHAMTLGHVILGVGQTELNAHRAHEQVHVRQYERWGPFFLPAYLLSSAWQLLTGGSPYRDNFFERQAFAVDDSGLSPCNSSIRPMT